MKSLKLGLVGLSPAENSLIATIFRLYGVDQSFIWVLASEPPYDALLVDVRSEHVALPVCLGGQERVMLLGEPGRPCEQGMSRPIRSDHLIKWLNDIELSVLDGKQNQILFAQPMNNVQVSGIDTPAPQPAVEKVRRRDEWKIPAYKLTKWPGSEFLKGDIHRVRMATILSRRALTVQQLSAVSRVAEDKCQPFLNELRGADLIEERMVDVPPAVTEPSHPSVHSALAPTERGPGFATARSIGAALIGSIRKRFGIF